MQMLVRLSCFILITDCISMEGTTIVSVRLIVPNLFFKLTDLWPFACMLVTLDMLKILCLQCFVCVYIYVEDILNVKCIC